MLKLGEIWSQTKRACKNPTELDGYDSMFHLRGYQAHLKGNDDILKIAMESAMSEGEGKTIRQRYEEQFDQLRNEGTAIRELMRLPDDPTVYSAQETKHLMDSFGAHFADAAQIVRKIQPAMQLVDEAAKAGIGFGGYAKEVPGQLSSASYVPDTHAAYIPEATVDPVRAAQNLWFTLTIGKNWSRVTELNILARAGTTAKEEYVNRRFKIDEEAVLKVGEIWSQTKRACKNPTELDGYDSMFHLQACQAHQQGDDDLLKIVMESGMVPGKTRRQFYEEQFDQLRNEATQP